MSHNMINQEQKKYYKCPNCGGILIDQSLPGVVTQLCSSLGDFCKNNKNRWKCDKCEKVFEMVNKEV